jgi:chromate transporter
MKSFLELFLIFFKLGAQTIGGGYVMLPILEKELVEKRKWYSESEFLDIIAIAQSSPGAIVVNAAMTIGHRRLGVIGGLVAVFGAVLPAFCIILLVGTFFFEIRDNEIAKKIFLGIRPAVVGLIGASALRLTKMSMKKTKKCILITILSFTLIVIVKLNPVYALLIGGAVGFLFRDLVRERIND